MANIELEKSYQMRESLAIARGNAKNAIRTQNEATDHLLRKRIFDTQRIRNENEWQIIKVNFECRIEKLCLNDVLINL